MTEEAYPELHVALEFLSSDMGPDEISDRLGLQPTKSWRAGDTETHSKVPHKDGRWILRLPPRPAVDFTDLVEELLVQLDPCKAEVAGLARDSGFSARLSCVGYMTTIVPAVYFENELLVRIAGLGLALNVDLFQLPTQLIPR
jgi:Domain of unknown function (DUF4279)